MSLRLSEFRKHFTILNTIAQKIECYMSKYKLIPCNPFREIRQSIILFGTSNVIHALFDGVVKCLAPTFSKIRDI